MTSIRAKTSSNLSRGQVAANRRLLVSLLLQADVSYFGVPVSREAVTGVFGTHLGFS